MKVADLFARIGIKDDGSKPLQDFLNTASNTVTGLVTLGRAVADVAVTIKGMAQESLDGAAALQQFQSETGASAQELQKWQHVAEATNSSAEAVTNSIKSLALNAEKIKLGQGNISGYQLLGIDPNQDPFEILEELRTKTADLAPAMRKNVLSTMGVSSELLQVIELTNDEFESMASRAFILDPSQIENMAKVRGSMAEITNAVNYLKGSIISGLAPQLADMNKKFLEWVKINEGKIIKTVKDIVTWIDRFITSIQRAWSMLDGVVDRTIGWDNAVKGLIAVFAILNASLLLSPIGLITAGIVALILVMEDLYVYSQGGKSLFGEMLKQFPALEAVLDPLSQLMDLIGAFASGDTLKINEILDEWGLFGDILQEIIDKLKEINVLQGGEAGKREGDVLGVGNLSRQQILSGGSNTTQNNTVNIYGSENPEATGQAVADKIQLMMNSAAAQRGVNQ